MINCDYEFSFIFGKIGTCTYCGEPADTIEHLIPWSVITSSDSSRKIKGFCTYACRECNCFASNRVFHTFEERVKFVHEKLRKKYKRYMGVVWDSGELNQTTGNLKKYIRGCNTLNKIARQRLAYPTSNEFWEILNSAREDAYLDPRIPKNLLEFLVPTDWTPSWVEK